MIIIERKRRIERLKENIGNFSSLTLKHRIASYSKVVKENEEIIALTKKIDALDKVDNKKITLLLNDMETLSLPTNFYKFAKFNKLYKEVLRKIEKYERDYLDIRFYLFDLTSDIEIETAIFTRLKKGINIVSKKIDISQFEQVNSSKKLSEKIDKTLTNIRKLEKISEKQTKPLSNDFIQNLKRLDLDINSISNNVDFMEFYINHIEKENKKLLSKIVNSHSKNKKLLKPIFPEIKLIVTEIDNLKKVIREDIKNLKQKKVESNSIILDDKISDLYLLVHSNIDFARFNNKYCHVTSSLLKHVRENHDLFASEIMRHKINDEDKRLSSINSSLSNFEFAINNLERMKINNSNNHSPQTISDTFLKVVNEYEEYSSVVKKNVEDISKVNYLTDKVNRKISLMNRGLLQIEFNINSLNETVRDNYNNKKEEIQHKVSVLWNNFKNNTNDVDNKIFSIIENLLRDINDLVGQTKASSFEIFFLKESIMYLNKYKGTDSKFDLLLDSISKSYKEQEFVETLRKIKEIIEIYEIN